MFGSALSEEVILMMENLNIFIILIMKGVGVIKNQKLNLFIYYPIEDLVGFVNTFFMMTIENNLI